MLGWAITKVNMDTTDAIVGTSDISFALVIRDRVARSLFD